MKNLQRTLTHYQRGLWAEHQACRFLKQQGFICLKKRYRSPWGEIDLIMQDATTLVAVEVRFRTSQTYGGALSSITDTHLKRMENTLLHFQSQYKQYQHLQLRLDCITWEAQQPLKWHQHIERI